MIKSIQMEHFIYKLLMNFRALINNMEAFYISSSYVLKWYKCPKRSKRLDKIEGFIFIKLLIICSLPLLSVHYLGERGPEAMVQASSLASRY